jgi:RNA polymerase sigma-70 factor, ECF subfamily
MNWKKIIGIMSKNLSTYSDVELVEMMSGDKAATEAAFTELYDRYALRVNAYCRTILHNREEAEDIFQDTFVKFYQNVRADYHRGSIIGYLITIARNLCLNHKRDAKSTVPIDEIDIPYYENNGYEDKEMSELLMMSLELLDRDSKEILVMRVFNDLSYNEISDIIGITAARARYLAFNAKAKIKNILSPYLKDVF